MYRFKCTQRKWNINYRIIKPRNTIHIMRRPQKTTRLMIHILRTFKCQIYRLQIIRCRIHRPLSKRYKTHKQMKLNLLPTQNHKQFLNQYTGVSWVCQIIRMDPSMNICKFHLNHHYLEIFQNHRHAIFKELT